MNTPRLVSLSQRVFGWLLYTYPAQFRHRYGAEMQCVFDECLRKTFTRTGLFGLARLWLFTVGDFLVNVPLVTIKLEREEGIMLRRTCDSLLALWLLIVCLPFFPVVALLIKLDSDGPVFFRQERIGRQGKPYTLYKLRSMTIASPQQITRVGKIIRPLKIDELPQLVNVIKGDMAIIGPHPPLPADVNMDNPSWQRLLARRPGMLGVIK